MQTHQLVAHPNFAPGEVKGVTVHLAELADRRLMLRFRVDGGTNLVLPAYRGRGRGEELWKTTCFELFLYQGEGRYREFNFSPSGQWAAYEFAGYRNLIGDFEPRQTPEIKHETGESMFMMTVFLDRRELEGVERAALAAVLEESGGRPSYWALAHEQLKPDFHDPTGFRITIPPASAR